MDTETTTRILNQNPWFAGLPKVLAKDIVRGGKFRRVKNAVLFAVGDEPNGLFAVLSGTVHISHTSAEGRLALLLTANAGSWFGETSVLDGRPRYTEARAVGPCEILQLSISDFHRIAGENVSHYMAFVRLLCDHHRLAMDHLASLGALPVSVRLAQRLLFFARAQQDSRNPTEIVSLSQERLASVVGVSRQALSAHLKELQHRGIISLGYRMITLRKRSALQQMVDGMAISIPQRELNRVRAR